LEGWDSWVDPKLSKAEKETLLLNLVKEKMYPEVRGKLTAKALMDYSDDPLIFAIKVSEVMLSFKSFVRLNQFSMPLNRC